MEQFEFLSDEAIVDSTNDLLKHPSIAETLKTITLKAPLPFTIGLFGKWGSGKSTIINFVNEKLREESSGIPVIIFDVWKYENDSLRRQFILTLAKELKNSGKLNNNFQLDPSLTNTHSRTYEGKVTFSKKALTRFLSYPVAGGLALAVIIILFFAYQISPQLFFIVLGSSIASLASLIAIPALLTYIPLSSIPFG